MGAAALGRNVGQCLPRGTLLIRRSWPQAAWLSLRARPAFALAETYPGRNSVDSARVNRWGIVSERS
jgi:hypothetical protein